MDDYIALVIPSSREQLDHVANAMLSGIHDVFPAADDDSNDPISLIPDSVESGMGTAARGTPESGITRAQLVRFWFPNRKNLVSPPPAKIPSGRG